MVSRLIASRVAQGRTARADPDVRRDRLRCVHVHAGHVDHAAGSQTSTGQLRTSRGGVLAHGACDCGTWASEFSRCC